MRFFKVYIPTFLSFIPAKLVPDALRAGRLMDEGNLVWECCGKHLIDADVIHYKRVNPFLMGRSRQPDIGDLRMGYHHGRFYDWWMEKVDGYECRADKLLFKEAIKMDDLSYVKVYDAGIEYLLGCVPRQLAVMAISLAMNMDSDNMIITAPDVREKIACTMGIRESSIKPALTKLVFHDIMARLSIGRYMVNPFIFSRCNEDHAAKLRTKYPEGKFTEWFDEQDI